MEIVDIIKAVKKQYILDDKQFGLCSSANWGFGDDDEGYGEQFKEYLKDANKGQTIFFTGNELYTTDDSDWYHWPKDDSKSRLRWLNKHIKLNK
tara:strand:- start:279 stop:560 length:282 start_codon:yes stop_codon:yes gene_type:complete